MGTLLIATYGQAKKDVIVSAIATDLLTVTADHIGLWVGDNAVNHLQIDSILERCHDALREDGFPAPVTLYLRTAISPPDGGKGDVVVSDQLLAYAITEDEIAVVYGETFAHAASTLLLSEMYQVLSEVYGEVEKTK